MVGAFVRPMSAGLAFALLASSPAAAHHMMDGGLPASFAQGILSGLGHPIIGLDHLAFLIATGVAVGAAGLSLAMPIAFVAASAIGVAIHVAGIGIPGAELAVAASVIAIGALVARGLALSPAAYAALFALAGLFHGYAFGESIFGAERTPLFAYLIGLVIIQSALAIGVAVLVRRREMGVGALTSRLTGAVVAGVGIAVIAQQVLPG